MFVCVCEYIVIRYFYKSCEHAWLDEYRFISISYIYISLMNALKASRQLCFDYGKLNFRWNYFIFIYFLFENSMIIEDYTV